MMFKLSLDNQFEEKLAELRSRYGEEMMKIEGMSYSQLDTTQFFSNFMNNNTVADASIDDNANVTGKTVTTMINESQKPFLKLLSRNKIYIEMKEEFGKKVADDFLEKAVNGQLYEHDSHLSSYLPYCFAFSVKPIVEKGLFFLDEMKANAPKHWDTFNHHILEFVSYATNQQAGAVGIPDYLIYAYYFYNQDVKDYNYDKKQANRHKRQKFQEFIFSLNQPYLKSGIQSAYTNVSILDKDHIIKFFGTEKYPNGELIINHLDRLVEFQKDFLDYIGELRIEKWYTFPVVSASLIFDEKEYPENDGFADPTTAKIVIEHNYKFGFNDVNIMMVSEATSLASCCRLVSDVSQLNEDKQSVEDKMEGKIFNSIGGSDVNVGSTKVVTLNLVRHALLANGSREKFLASIKEDVELIHKYHYTHRLILQKLVDKGLLPLYSHGLMSFEDQFATIGINGVFEATKILGGISNEGTGPYYSNTGFGIMEETFDVINTANHDTPAKYGFSSNVEQIPAESTAIKLLDKDRVFFGNRLIDETLGKDYYIYGNQWIPLKEDTSVLNRINAAKLDNFCGGGAILHINLGENFNSFEDAWDFTVSLANKGVKYFSYISLIDICEEDHSFFGDTCPICNGPSITKGIKIVGYLVKQHSFKKQRKQELDERQMYSL